jgi:hypothetical protein
MPENLSLSLCLLKMAFRSCLNFTVTENAKSSLEHSYILKVSTKFIIHSDCLTNRHFLYLLTDGAHSETRKFSFHL